MTEPLLNVASDWTGQWWLPDAPDEKMPGVLSYDPDRGLRLRLIGGWDYTVTRPGPNGGRIVLNKLKQWPMILGEGDGKPITLLDAWVVSAKSYGWVQKPNKLEVHASTALIGCLLDDPDEAPFTSAEATIENLSVWASRTGLEGTENLRPDYGEVAATVLRTRLEPLEIEVDEVTARLRPIGLFPYTNDTRWGRSLEVREHHRIEFSSAQPRTVQHWLGLLSGMADLISLATLSACGIITARVYLPPTPDAFEEDHPARDMFHEVVVYTRRIVTPEPHANAATHRNMVMTLEDVGFDTLMTQWMHVREKYAAARSMILGLQYVTGGYLETQVVSAVAAAESFHRALETEPPVPPDEFAALRTLLLRAVPKQRKPWLADRLISNEPTLKQRLLELVARLGAPGVALVHDPDTWAKVSAQARNTLAHVGPSDKHTYDQLRAVVKVTEAVVILNLLLELGVPEERLSTAIVGHPVLSHAAQLSQEVLTANASNT